MKRIFTLTMSLLFTAGLFAQSIQPGPVPVDQPMSKPTAAKQMMLQKNSNKSLESRWYCYAVTMDDVLQTASFNFNNLFPDTTILVNYSSGYSGPWIHSLGNMIDPTSDWFNDPTYYPTDLKINDYMSYSLDSIGMNFIYLRHLASSSIVDTLRFQVLIDPIKGSNMPRYYWSTGNVPTNFGVDTVWFKGIKFNTSTLDVIGTGVQTYDVLLTESFANDTLNDGTHWAEIATPQFSNVPAGNVVGVYVTFLPGYSWVANVDTLWNKNSVRFFSYEENGDGTFPNYTKGDYNCSSIGNDQSHFDHTSSWYGMDIPTWAWTATYGYENHLMWYRLTADASGFESIDNGALTLKQNYPNPADNSTTIVFELSRSSNVNLGVFDITGKQVMSLPMGMVSSGQHEISLDLDKLNSGMYFFTLQAGNNKLSRKMIVQH